MNIQIGDWQDNSGKMREQIVRDVIDIMFRYFHNDALFKNDLQIIDIHTANCPWADENPCTHFDRSRICLNVQGTYWCQFIHQLSHELCHCSTSRHQLPQKIKWFDEFICCCSSYLVETIISLDRTHRYDYMFPGRAAEVFGKYLRTKIDGNIYVVENTTEFFAVNRKKYEANQNLIKSHEVYIRSFFEALNGDFSGLSFVGKMYLVQTNDDMIIEEFLQKLLILCDTNEKLVIYQICKLFGIKLARQMKDSGIAWVGKIPQEWETRRTKYCFKSKKEIVGTRADDYERLALTMNGVIRRSKDDNTGLQPEKFETYQILRPNELVFKLIDLQNVSTSRVGLSPFLGLVSPAYIILKSSNGKVLPRFAEKYFLMLWKNQIFNALGDAGVRSSLNITDLLEIPLVFPSIDEQQRITNFLDKECEKIDDLKADIQAQIDTLEQYKRSIITEAVTHGLNPDAPMKDSGIDYIDKIKADWKISKIGFVCTKLTRGFLEDDPALICSNNGSVMPRDEQRACGKMVSEDNAMQGIRAGDIAIHGMDTWHGAIGFSKIRGKITRVVHVCDSTEDNRFIVYYLKSLAYQGVYKLISNGVRGNTSDFRSWDKVKDIYICLPNTIEEETHICDYLDNVIESVDKIIADKKVQLDTLDDYKKSLIYEYVTGKKGS